jgi:Flp pilus assembly protein TadD/cell division protein FtsN
MRQFVQRIMRGVIFCLVIIAINACAGTTGEQAAQNPVAKSDRGLPRIDAIRLRVARNAVENGDYNTAIRFFESVRNSSPSHPAPILGIAKAHLAAGSHADAIQAYRDVLELDSSHEEALDGIGRALVLISNYREAIDYFKRLLARAPSAALHNRLGVAHDLMGDGESAQKHYREALALDPEAISPRNNLALSLAISENYEEAIKQIERVAAHPQATSKHRQNLSFVYGMAGENNTAAATFSENGLTPAEIAKKRALYKRIRALAQAGKHAEILEYLRNGQDLGEPMVAGNVSRPGGTSTDMASAMTDSAPTDKVMPPKPLVNHKTLSEKTAPKPARMAKLSDPAKRGQKRARPAKTTVFGSGIYRVQLAAYRTARAAARGVKILHSILKENTPDLNILVRQIRRTEKRAIDYRIRTSQIPNRDAAGRLCTEIKTAGFPDCLVIQHNPRVWANVDQPGLTPDTKVAGVTQRTKHTGRESYRVQLASFRTKRGAARGQAVLKKMLGDRAVDLDILVKRTKNRDPAAFNYQIRTGPIKSRDEGAALCETLKKAGHSDCLVVRHSDLLWKNLAEAGKQDMVALGGPAAGAQNGSGQLANSQGGSQGTLPALQVLEAPALSDDARQISYRVQLASYRTELGAAKGQAVLKKMLGDRAVNLEILVKRVKNSDPSGFDYQIRTGPLKTLTDGADLCEVLKKAGHPGCLVVGHNDLIWKSLSKDKASLGGLNAKPGQIKQRHRNRGQIKQGHSKQGQIKQDHKKDIAANGPQAALPPREAMNAPTPLRHTKLPSYRVQLASFRTERGAAKGQAVLRKLLGDRAVTLDILVKRSKEGDPAAFNYQIRTGPIKSRDEGAALCETLRKAGHPGCLVVEHNDLLWKNLATAAKRGKEQNKASLGGHEAGSRSAAKYVAMNGRQAAETPHAIIELPSSNIRETGHTTSPRSSGFAVPPAILMFGPVVTPMAEI